MGVKWIVVLGLLGLVACDAGAIEGRDRLLVTRADGAIVVVATNGSELHLLDEGAEITRPIQATASPQGKVVWVDQTSPDRIALWDGERTRTVDVPFDPFYFAWSPSGGRLAMLGNGTAGVAGVILDIDDNVIDLGQARPFFLDWSPTGESIIAHLDGQSTVLIDPTTGGRRPISESAIGFGAPEFRSDTEVITVRGTSGVTAGLGTPFAQTTATELLTTDLSTSRSTVLARVEALTSFSVSPDGRVAFVTGDGAEGILFGELQVVGGDAEESTLVSGDPVVTLEWNPSGTHLLFHTLDLETVELTAHVWDGATVRDFDAYRPTELYVSQYLPFADQYARSQTAWSPDGSAFAYARSSDAGGEVWVQPLDGPAVTVGPGEGVSWIP